MSNLFIILLLFTVIIFVYYYNNQSIELFQSDLRAYNLIANTNPLTATRQGNRYIRKYLGNDFNLSRPITYYYPYEDNYGWPYFNSSYNFPYYWY